MVNTTFRILVSTQHREQPRIVSVLKWSPSISEAGRKGVLITGTEIMLGVRVGGPDLGWEKSLGSYWKWMGRFSAKWSRAKLLKIWQNALCDTRDGCLFSRKEDMEASKRQQWEGKKEADKGTCHRAKRSKAITWKCFSNLSPAPIRIPTGRDGHRGLQWTRHIFLDLPFYSIIGGGVAQGYSKNRDIGSSTWHCLPW